VFILALNISVSGQAGQMSVEELTEHHGTVALFANKEDCGTILKSAFCCR
jgi:hypothetical protein